MGGAEGQKYRHELKYLISSAQAAILRSRLERLMRPDPHGGREGYCVRSLYLDSYDNRCFYENENGVSPREKYRIRIYNHSPERIMLERKRKEMELTQKTSCPLTAALAEGIAGGSSLFPGPEQPPLLRLLAVRMQTELYRPAVIVEYDRIPFVSPVGNIRVTLDMNISASSHLACFLEERIPRRPVMPAGQHLLEVKFDGLLPGFIHQSLQLENLQHTTYSKYYLCRKFESGQRRLRHDHIFRYI